MFSDVPRLIEMTQRLVTASGIPQQVDPEHTKRSFKGLMISDFGAVWVTDGGFLAASIEQTIISPSPVAVEHGWYADDGSGLRLLRKFQRWAAKHGATERLSTGVGGLDLSRLGYRPVETAWIK
jgi:hypothetical protein